MCCAVHTSHSVNFCRGIYLSSDILRNPSPLFQCLTPLTQTLFCPHTKLSQVLHSSWMAHPSSWVPIKIFSGGRGWDAKSIDWGLNLLGNLWSIIRFLMGFKAEPWMKMTLCTFNLTKHFWTSFDGVMTAPLKS